MSDDKHNPARTYDAMNPRGLAGKRDYVRSLEQRRDEEAMSLLVECLCDESWYLRELAEDALLRMGARAGDTLVPLLDNGLWFSRASAARVLGRLGHGPAVPALLRLCVESNTTVAAAALAALTELGHRGGSVRIAWELHHAGAELRRRHLDQIERADRDLATRIQGMLAHDELMTHTIPDELRDDTPLVRASEEGVEWEVLTGPPTRAAGGGGATPAS